MSSIEEGGGARVLLADDDPTFRLLAASALTQAGFAVTQAEGGAEALEAFRRMRPQVVLLDFEMPGMDGFEVCEKLRRLEEARFTPIVIITGYDAPEAVDRAYRAGATDFLSKPVPWEMLPRRVQYVLRASRAFEKLRRSEALLERAQQLAHLGNWEWSAASGRITGSKEFLRILGSDPGGDIEAFYRMVHEEDRDCVRRNVAHVSAEGGSFSLDHRVVRPNGEERIVHHVAGVVMDSSGAPSHAWGILQDITDRKRAEHEIWQLAHCDGLTGLANRRLLTERLEAALRSAEARDKTMAVLYLDLDRFKRINDSFGHASGDVVLTGVAQRLIGEVRLRDWVGRGGADEAPADVSRLGGDEFTVVLTDLEGHEPVMRVAQRLLEALRAPFQVSDCEISASASIGIAVFPTDGTDAETLLRNADAAMYHAKKRGGDTFQFYTESMNADFRERLVLESDLRHALDRREFALHYQPKTDILSGRLLGLEGLIRWQHPRRGLISPAEFVPAAEDCGLIVRIGEWVIRSACEQLVAWEAEGLRTVSVSVNVSGHQLQQGFVEFVAKTLKETGIGPGLLELEVTESALIRDEDVARRVLSQLKEMGIALAMDDFGTGYSSLSFLKRYAVDCLKIDRSFVSRLVSSEDDAAIVSAIIEMAHRLRLQVVAEGVETEEARSFLRQLGCDQIQGYLIARPMPAESVADLLSAERA